MGAHAIQFPSFDSDTKHKDGDDGGYSNNINIQTVENGYILTVEGNFEDDDCFVEVYQNKDDLIERIKGLL